MCLRCGLRPQDARLDPMVIPLDEYKERASMLELCDLQSAAEKLQSTWE